MSKAKTLISLVAEATKTKKKYKMSKTYETWNEESLEAGETDDKGFEYEDQEFDTLWDLADEIRDAGATEPSGSPSPHTWYSTPDADEDYRTGNKTYYSFHPSDLTQFEAEKLDKMIKDDDYFKSHDPDNLEDETEEDEKERIEREREEKNLKLF